MVKFFSGIKWRSYFLSGKEGKSWKILKQLIFLSERGRWKRVKSYYEMWKIKNWELKIVKSCQKNVRKWKNEINEERKYEQSMFSYILRLWLYLEKRPPLLFADQFLTSSVWEEAFRGYKVQDAFQMLLTGSVLHESLDSHSWSLWVESISTI